MKFHHASTVKPAKDKLCINLLPYLTAPKSTKSQILHLSITGCNQSKKEVI